MTLDQATSIIGQMLHIAILMSLPTVGMGLLVGLMISVFQAITQIQEQTLTFVPKMIVVLLILALTFPWMYQLIMELCFNLWGNIPLYAK